MPVTSRLTRCGVAITTSTGGCASGPARSSIPGTPAPARSTPRTDHPSGGPEGANGYATSTGPDGPSYATTCGSPPTFRHPDGTRGPRDMARRAAEPASAAARHDNFAVSVDDTSGANTSEC